jgi:hypothetical protein
VDFPRDLHMLLKVGYACSTWVRCSFIVPVPPEGARLNKGYLHQSGLFCVVNCNYSLNPH